MPISRRMSFENARTISETMSTRPTSVSRSRSLSDGGRRNTTSASEEEELPAIQHRDGKQVEDGEVDRDQRHEGEEGVEPEPRTLRGELADQNRTTDLAAGDPGREQSCTVRTIWVDAARVARAPAPKA